VNPATPNATPRKWITVAAATSLALCVAASVAWAMSYTRPLPARPVQAGPGVTITFGDGEVDIYSETRHPLPQGGLRGGAFFYGIDLYVNEAPVGGWPIAPGATPRYIRESRYRVSPPHYVVLFAVLPAWWLFTNPARRAARRRARGLCPICGYDLRGNPGRCPECGMYSPRATPSDAPITIHPPSSPTDGGAARTEG
jgi:hypothetical protein